MPATLQIQIPLKVSVGVEIDRDIFEVRMSQLLRKPHGGGNSLHPAAENFLVSTKHLVREAAAWALATKSSEHSLESARTALLAENITVSAMAQ